MSAMAIKNHPGLAPLAEVDPDMAELIAQEQRRQFTSIELIASENFASRAIMDCLGSCLTNKYAEGLPGKRYYGGNEIIDQIENMCKARALTAYRLSSDDWGVNVQPYSGSPANFAVYTGLLPPHSRIMGLDLPSGGHLTHGFYTLDKKTMSRKPVSATSVYFESLPYKVKSDTGLIDFEELAKMAAVFKPALIVCGGSAYPRDWDYAKFREIADANGSLLMMDMAHISGLIATEEAADPFKYCDIVTTTTHKSLRGPRGAMIFYRKGAKPDGTKYELEDAINFAVFPGLQGGPHNHTITALATALKQCQAPGYKAYQEQVMANSSAMADALLKKGYALVSGGTDNHLVLVDLKNSKKIDGARVEAVLELANIACNKNTIPGDKSALSPGGVRLGAPALTTRGFVQGDFETVVDFFDRGVKIALDIKAEGGKLKDFRAKLKEPGHAGTIGQLKKDVSAFASGFPTVGF
mmetsp:Transcript_32303/g.97088  ORF Transcript_32303/g.97088 Transcript_32303/m.97088 type:complete len:468 (+) Transcript_32303:162-1565(+)